MVVMARLSDHPTQGGRVIDWTPSQATLDAMAVAPATGVTPSLMQAAHLALAKSKNRDGYTDSSWLCMAFELPGPFDVDAWTRQEWNRIIEPAGPLGATMPPRATRLAIVA